MIFCSYIIIPINVLSLFIRKIRLHSIKHKIFSVYELFLYELFKKLLADIRRCPMPEYLVSRAREMARRTGQNALRLCVLPRCRTRFAEKFTGFRLPMLHNSLLHFGIMSSDETVCNFSQSALTDFYHNFADTFLLYK